MKVPVNRAFIRTIKWQILASSLLAVVAGWLAGIQGALSALLGGGIGVAGVVVFALVLRRPSGDTRGALRAAIRAEAAKVLVVVVLLWFAFVAYHTMVVLAFLGAFMVSVLLSGLAFATSGDQLNSSKV